MNRELSDAQARFRKGRGTRDQIDMEVGHRRPDPTGGRGAPVKADAFWGVAAQAHPHSKGGPGRQPNGRGNGLHRRGDKRQGGVQSPIMANYWSDLLRSQLIGKGGRKHGCRQSRSLAALQASAQWTFAVNCPDTRLGEVS